MDFVMLANHKGVIIVCILRTDWMPEWVEGGPQHAFGEMFNYDHACDHLGIDPKNVVAIMPIVANSDEAQEYALAELSEGIGGIDWATQHGDDRPMDMPDAEGFELLTQNLERWANRKIEVDPDVDAE